MRYFKTIVALAFLLVLFIPLYGWVAQVLNGLGPTNLVDSFALTRGGAEPDVSGVFFMGDSLTVEAESQWADSCELRIFENSSVILTMQDVFMDSAMETEVRLSPSLFSVGHSYVATLDVYSYNKPILGVYLSDSVASAFMVESAETSLGLQVEYDDVVGSLRLNADLSTVDGYPLADESVRFLLQFNTHRPTEGWFPVGSFRTDSSGEAELNLAFGLADGNYRVRAVYDGSVDYGKSENSTEIGISSESTLKNIGLDTVYEYDGSSVPMSITNVGELSLEVSNSTPYALLPTTARANYTVDVPLGGSEVFIVFFLDYTNRTGVLGAARFFPSEGPPYEGSLVWSPSVLGQHRLIAQVGNGSIADLARMQYDGSGSIQSGEVLLDISRCPSNLVLDYPRALYGNVLPVTVAVAKPRPYEDESNEFYATSTLAPHFFYDGAEYVIDEPMSAAWTRIFVNGTESYAYYTNEYGIIQCLIPLNFTSAQLEAVIDDPLLSQQTVQRSVSFRKIRVYDRPAFEGAAFQLNYTVGNLDEAGNVYVGVDHEVEVSSSFFNQSVWNLPLSILTAKFVSNATTDASGFVSIPAGADYLRVHDTVVLEGDATGDGIVNLVDSAFLSAHWYPGPPVGRSGDDPDADFNRDGKVDVLDSAILGANWNKKAYRVVFNNDPQPVPLDSLGCAEIPSGATGLTVYKDNVGVPYTLVEFFTITMEELSQTNDLGKAEETWTPNELGKYLLQVKVSPKFDVSTVVPTSVTCLNAKANLVEYFEVVKRTVDLSVSFEPSPPTIDTWVTMTVNVLDVGLAGPPVESLDVQFYINDTDGTYVFMGTADTNASGIATFSWLPRDYTNFLGLSPDFALRVLVPSSAYTLEAEKVPVCVDARYPTRLEFLTGGEEAKKFNVGQGYRLSAKLTRVDTGFPEPEKTVALYVNDTKIAEAPTDHNGIAYWDLTFNQPGAYNYRAVFETWERHYFESPSASSLDGQIDYWQEFSPPYRNWYTVNSDGSYAQIGYYYNPEGGGTSDEWRMYVSFDTSSVPKSAVVASATLRMKAFYDYSTTDFDISVFGGTQPIYDGVLNASAWDNGWNFQSSRSTSSIVVDQYMDWAIQASQVKKGGRTQFEVRQGAHTSYSYVAFYTGERYYGYWPLLQVYYDYKAYVPSEDRFAAVVGANPTNVEFDVQPRVFTTGSQITLSALVRDAVTNDTLDNVLVDFFKVDQSGVETQIGSDLTDSTGVAEYAYNYDVDSGPYAFKASAHDQVATSAGLMLTVASPTGLSLNITKDDSSFIHTISGRLTSNGTGVEGKRIKLLVDGAEIPVTTSSDGSFSTTLNLPPVNNGATEHTVQAVFEGDAVLNATAYATAQDGSRYPVCTTIQYVNGSESGSGSSEGGGSIMSIPMIEGDSGVAARPVTVTVQPQATTTTQPTKTQEEIEQEAKDSTWLRVEPEFSWWFPWFRLHLKLNVNLPQGNPKIDYGWSALPFGISYNANNNVLANILNDASYSLREDVFTSYIVGMIIQFGTALFLGRTGIYVAAAIVSYAAFSAAMALRLYLTSGNNHDAWLGAFVASAIGGTCGLVASGISSVAGVLTSASRLILGKITSIMHSLWGGGLNFFNITGVAFALIDFAFMVFYLSRYLGP